MGSCAERLGAAPSITLGVFGSRCFCSEVGRAAASSCGLTGATTRDIFGPVEDGGASSGGVRYRYEMLASARTISANALRAGCAGAFVGAAPEDTLFVCLNLNSVRSLPFSSRLTSFKVCLHRFDACSALLAPAVSRSSSRRVALMASSL